MEKEIFMKLDTRQKKKKSYRNMFYFSLSVQSHFTESKKTGLTQKNRRIIIMNKNKKSEKSC